MTAPSPYFYHPGHAADAVLFIERFCVFTKGEWAGQPFKLERWQREEIIEPLWGWRRKCGGDCGEVACKRPKDQHPRRYRIAYVEVPRKNGKTEMAAAVALALLHHDQEPGAEVYGVAGDLDQARLVFSAARYMVENSPQLSRMCEVYGGREKARSILVPRTNSFYKVISNEDKTKHGLSAHGIIFDEFHVQQDADLYDVLHTSTSARRQPLEFIITTSGYDRKSPCWKMHEHAVAVRDGLLEDPEFLAVLYCSEEDDDWRDPELWKRVNPNLGVSKKFEYMESECRHAVESPDKENTFRRLDLDQWTEQDVRWIPMAAWDECSAPPLREGIPVAGLDLASVSDICALDLYWPETCSVEPFFFVPQEGITKRAREDRVPYADWARRAMLIATKGARTDYGFIRRKLRELREEVGLQHIFIDRWNSSHLINELQDDGFICVEVPPSMSQISAPAKELEAIIAERKLRHGGNPVLRWMASNVVVKHDADDNIRPDKEKSGDKIDGITALVLAILGSKSVRSLKSKYEEDDLVTVTA